MDDVISPSSEAADLRCSGEGGEGRKEPGSSEGRRRREVLQASKLATLAKGRRASAAS